MPQPANVDILVKRRVRSYRQNLRHANVHGLVNRLRGQVMSIPARETLDLTYRAVDANSDVVTTALQEGRGTGLPIVRGLKPVVSLPEAVAGIGSLDFPVVIGQDRFLNKADGALNDDLHQDTRDVLTPLLPDGTTGV
tara:strand:+ start:136380 stop:136793 length:414 start_codon:yes stop_codon:yes gene_type:complete